MEITPPPKSVGSKSSKTLPKKSKLSQWVKPIVFTMGLYVVLGVGFYWYALRPQASDVATLNHLPTDATHTQGSHSDARVEIDARIEESVDAQNAAALQETTDGQANTQPDVTSDTKSLDKAVIDKAVMGDVIANKSITQTVVEAMPLTQDAHANMPMSVAVKSQSASTKPKIAQANNTAQASNTAQVVEPTTTNARLSDIQEPIQDIQVRAKPKPSKALTQAEEEAEAQNDLLREAIEKVKAVNDNKIAKARQEVGASSVPAHEPIIQDGEPKKPKTLPSEQTKPSTQSGVNQPDSDLDVHQ